ncbi:hypothetical protein BH24CHL3_BH24CHL3_10200 [soil metagenome]
MALTISARVEAAKRYAEGVYFVDLSSTTDPALVVNAIAQAVGVRTASGRSLENVLADFLRSKRLLLFLDNFEQVIPGALRVADVLTTAPDVAMLVTSREPLLISHEHLYAVPPLPVSSNTGQLAPPDLAASDSVRLFVARAQQARADFQLTPDNAGIIESICQRLDGLPLAIELAAARIAMFTPGALLARMDRSHPLLTGGPRDAPHRLRSMHDAIAWSYDLLFPEEQLIFRSLAYFAGGWTIEAAEYVCRPDARGAGAELQWSIVDRLTSLAAKNIIQPDGDDGPDSRFTMLQTVREYGLEQLESSSELEAIGRRHAGYFRQLASQAEPALYGRDQAEWLDRLELAFPNLRLAVVWSMEHGSPDEGVLVVTALWRLWHMRLDVAEGRELLTRLLDHRTTLSESCLAIALIVASDLAQNQGDYPAAAALGEEGLSLARATGDTRVTGLALAVIGTNERVQGKADEAIDHLTEALTIVEALDDKPFIAQTLWLLGDIERERGDISAGRAMLESSLAIARSIDDVWQVAWSLGYLADTARTAGEHEQSLYLDQEGLVLQRDLKSTWGIVGSITGLAVLAATWDQSERAARLLGARASLRSKLGMPRVWPMHRHWYDPLIRKLRQDIGSDAFDAIWAEGAALTVDQVVA